MKCRAAMCATVVLLSTISLVETIYATWLTLPESDSQNARLEVIKSTPEQTVLSWNAGSLSVSEDNEGSDRYALLGIEAQSRVEGMLGCTRLVRLPWGYNAQLQVTESCVVQFSASGELLQSVRLEDSPFEAEEWVLLGQAGVFRDVTVAPLQLNPMKIASDGSVWVASNLQLVLNTTELLEGVSGQEPTRPVSRAFWPLYQELLADDLDDLGIRLATTKGTYLIVAHNSYVDQLQTFITWKKQKGYEVDLHVLDSSPSFSQMQSLIADKYHTSDPPLEFVLLVGDSNRGAAAALPTGLIQNTKTGENDATDWRYANIEGGDYFPEVFIGRMTAGSSTDVFSMTLRTIRYEKNDANIPLTDNYWRTAHLVGANFSEGGDGTSLSPVATTRWLAERMLEDWNVPVVNLFLFEQGGQQATADDIVSAINATGGLWVTYRGWGNATGWMFPEFKFNDIGRLMNVNRLCVLTSFVCNTGDFGNLNHPASFGERWLVANTPTQPAGAVAMIGPTDLYTETAYNNSLIAGFYTGVYTDNLHNISQALLRSKVEVYNNFPLKRENGDRVEFYWHIYHVLGDPELTMWRHAPKEMTVTIPEEITFGQNHLEVSVQGTHGPLANAYVQLIQGETLFSGSYTDAAGLALIPMEDVALGVDVQVTVTCHDYLLQVHTLPVVQAPRYVGLASWEVDAGSDGLVNVDETVGLTVTLRNDGTEAVNGVSAMLSSMNGELITVNSGEASFGNLSPGAQASNTTSAYSFTLNGRAPDGAMIELDLAITDDGTREWSGKIWIPVGALSMQYQAYSASNGTFEPGQNPTLELTFRNLGSVPAENLTATLSSWDQAVTVINGVVEGVNIQSDANGAVGPFVVEVAPSTYRGRVVRFGVDFTRNGAEVDRLNFTIPLEGATSTDPLGPDAHGYFIYDDTDSQWQDEAPTFTWFDLDQDDGATQYDLFDDDKVSIELPFDFTFYGRTYESGSPVTVSSNGWVSFKEESQFTVNFFRNWGIPSSLGPTGFIAAFWDDLKNPFGSNTMKVFTKYDEGEGRFIIEWFDALNRFGHNSDIANPAQFALVLYDPAVVETVTGDGVIEIYYNEINNVDELNNYGTVGLMNLSRTIGLEYTYANLYPAAAAPLAGGRALRITTNPPDTLLGVTERRADTAIPGVFALHQNYPNPFNSSTEIVFDIPVSSDVHLSVYNLLGQEIAVLIDRPMTAGHKQVTWQVNDKNLSSGMLLVRLEAGTNLFWNKMMYVK